MTEASAFTMVVGFVVGTVFGVAVSFVIGPFLK